MCKTKGSSAFHSLWDILIGDSLAGLQSPLNGDWQKYRASPSLHNSV